MKQAVTYLYDDLTGKPGDDVTTVQFSVGGADYEIDLDPKNVAKLEKVLTPFISAGRTPSKVTGKKIRKQSYPYSRELQQKVRAWAAKKGIDVPDRGRLKKEVVEEFLAYGKN